MTTLSNEPLDLDSLLAETEDDSAGALVVFSGTIRNHHDSKSVDRLSYSAYAPIADTAIAEIEQEVKTKFGVSQCRIMHRIGDLEIGDIAIHCVVRSAHRGEAFEAAKYAIDTTKSRVPIWKEEHYSDGTSVFREGTPLKADNE